MPTARPTTAFVLVAGAHTGSWVWDEVAGALRRAGAEAYPAPLTGLEDGRPAAVPPGVDLETHIAELTGLIDRTGAAELVLVGHGYGLLPVLGAAGRRPGRVARIVHLDTGVAEDGDTALTLLPALAEPAGRGPWVAPPARGDWHRLGSTAGLSPAGLDRLAGRAVAQPAATLTAPLRLPEAVAAVPRSGVLCTGNGSTLARVEELVALGDPRLRSLAGPRTGFFELDTGHWPMLSAPGELARVLLAAAAGEGRRISPSAAGIPARLRPFPLSPVERPRDRIGRVDLYAPDADGPRPAVVFVHGGPVPARVRPTPRDWPLFTGYARYAAERGVVGVTVDHRLHGTGEYERAAGDVAEAVEVIRADHRVDGDRVALWFFSAGGLLAADWLAAPPPWLRCLAASYPVLAPLPGWGATGDRFRPAAAVRGAGRLPLVLTRVGRESPEIAATVTEFLAVAEECGARVEVVDVPHGRHAFETLDVPDHAAEVLGALDRAMGLVVGLLRPARAAAPGPGGRPDRASRGRPR
ncbi:alpha/beta hydrolase [Streptomyces sp. LP05-1]|uniref:Alpha/beta hydrolase n=1 Tax=Streptomyces pyxinae TaxID=2970734 RepID=A0ABT2CFM7_9ACTN|nr:alpha/beta fold hydrolase [Streptomyces sp. LP05-1]MCS0635434.1 alpha/beta hydrolase [Streptomyces sp. LP05-1]